jgi:hypothetical protein
MSRAQEFADYIGEMEQRMDALLAELKSADATAALYREQRDQGERHYMALLKHADNRIKELEALLKYAEHRLTALKAESTEFLCYCEEAIEAYDKRHQNETLDGAIEELRLEIKEFAGKVERA